MTPQPFGSPNMWICRLERKKLVAVATFQPKKEEHETCFDSAKYSQFDIALGVFLLYSERLPETIVFACYDPSTSEEFQLKYV